MVGFGTAIFSKTSWLGMVRFGAMWLGETWHGYFFKNIAAGCGEAWRSEVGQGLVWLFFLNGFWRRFETPPNPFVLVLLQMPSSLVREICTVSITNREKI